MRRAPSRLVIAAVVLTVWLGMASAGTVPCDVIIARVNRNAGKERGRAPDMSELAKQLGTSTVWVEHCMITYGRRSKRPGLESAEGREERLESLEEDEPEETGLEDVEEPGAREEPEHPAKPRQFKSHVEPTPDTYFDQRE